MPEKNRTPSKSQQAAPAAHSAGNTPSLGQRMEPIKPDLRARVATNNDATLPLLEVETGTKFPTLEKFSAEIEHGKDVIDAKQRGEQPPPTPIVPNSQITTNLDVQQLKSGRESDNNESPAPAWQGQLPPAVLQDGEFVPANTIIVDEAAERAAGLAKYKQERKERQKALKTGPFRFFKGEPRETDLERKFTGGASYFLGTGISIVCGFLRLFGLRDLSGRFVLTIRNFTDRIIEGTFLRYIRNYGHQWSMYRLAVRVIGNIDKNVQKQIGPEPGKDVENALNDFHREGKESWETARRELMNFRNETGELVREARERTREGLKRVGE